MPQNGQISILLASPGVKQSIDTPPRPKPRRDNVFLFHLTTRGIARVLRDNACLVFSISVANVLSLATPGRVEVKQEKSHPLSSDCCKTASLSSQQFWQFSTNPQLDDLDHLRPANWYFYHLLPDIDSLTHRFFWSAVLDAGGKFSCLLHLAHLGIWNLALWSIAPNRIQQGSDSQMIGILWGFNLYNSNKKNTQCWWNSGIHPPQTPIERMDEDGLNGLNTWHAIGDLSIITSQQNSRNGLPGFQVLRPVLP